MEGSVGRAEFSERKDNCDSRFSRDKERIDKQEGQTDDIRKLLVVTNQLVLQHEDAIKRLDARMVIQEGRSGKRWDSMVGKVFDYLIAAGLGFLIAYVSSGAKP